MIINKHVRPSNISWIYQTRDKVKSIFVNAFYSGTYHSDRVKTFYQPSPSVLAETQPNAGDSMIIKYR